MTQDDPMAGVAVFVAAARAGSFALAAQRLGTTRATRLTAEGESYLVACTAAMDGIEAAQAAFRPGRRGLVGPIHIDMPVAFGRRVLLPILTVKQSRTATLPKKLANH